MKCAVSYKNTYVSFFRNGCYRNRGCKNHSFTSNAKTNYRIAHPEAAKWPQKHGKTLLMNLISIHHYFT